MPKDKHIQTTSLPMGTGRTTIATACGKVILFGEHAVVYGRPAIAVPVTQVQAQATVEESGDHLILIARDLGQEHRWGNEPSKELEPLVTLVEATLRYLRVNEPPPLRITLTSTIPIARGLGSGAAVATALVRGVSQHLGHELAPQEVSRLVYEAERFYHGTPSGIDNTVIAYEKAIWFVKGQEPETLTLGQPLDLVIADSGIKSPTKKIVQAVRQAYDREPQRFEKLLDKIGILVDKARQALLQGDLQKVGELVSANHGLLRAMGVSLPILDTLVKAAEKARALGAKLSGAGRGGSVIVLVKPQDQDRVAQALLDAEAKSIIHTRVE